MIYGSKWSCVLYISNEISWHWSLSQMKSFEMWWIELWVTYSCSNNDYYWRILLLSLFLSFSPSVMIDHFLEFYFVIVYDIIPHDFLIYFYMKLTDWLVGVMYTTVIFNYQLHCLYHTLRDTPLFYYVFHDQNRQHPFICDQDSNVIVPIPLAFQPR